MEGRAGRLCLVCSAAVSLLQSLVLAGRCAGWRALHVLCLCVALPPLQVVGLEARVDVEMRERQRLLSQASDLQTEVLAPQLPVPVACEAAPAVNAECWLPPAPPHSCPPNAPSLHKHTCPDALPACMLAATGATKLSPAAAVEPAGEALPGG